MGDQSYGAIARELVAMAEIDQEMRAKASADMSLWDDAIDRRNTARLQEIIEEIGWPTISKVGPEASHDAWLLAQHAASDARFMKRCLVLMMEAAAGDVAPVNVAYLQDRLLIMDDKPQLYGTQFHSVEDGELEAFPIENPEYIDERRASVGLGSFAEYEADMKRINASGPS